MATRLATARNFITVTSVTNDEADVNTSVGASNTNSIPEGQRTAQLTPVSLHHVNLSQVSCNAAERLISVVEIAQPSRKKLSCKRRRPEMSA